MKNLQGIIRKSVNNAAMQYERLGYISTNTANYNTFGYKSVRFENYIREDGLVDGTLRTDYRNGSIYSTGRELDVAINGAGFIPVTDKDGEVAYTRAGSFQINKERLLTTSDNDIVGSGIKIPVNAYRVFVDKSGTVSVSMGIDQKAEEVGKIPVVNFNNPEGLELSDGNKLLATEKSGEAYLVKDHDLIQQGSLERSNVDLFGSVNDVLRLNASLVASTRMIKYTDELYQQSINLRQ